MAKQQPQQQPQRPIGQAATLNGKAVFWAGDDYGWQSPTTFGKMMEEGQIPDPSKPQQNNGGKKLGAGLAIGAASEAPRHPKARLALEENKRNARNVKPRTWASSNTGYKGENVKNETRTYTNRTAGTQVTIDETTKPGATRAQRPRISSDIAFQDTTAEPNSYNQRAVKGKPIDTKLRSAVIQDQIARGTKPVMPGDTITANPTTPSRARLYERMGGKAFGATKNPNYQEIMTTQQPGGKGSVNLRGEKAPPINLEKLKGPLKGLANKKLLGALGPWGRALSLVMQVDGLIEGITGKGVGTRINEGSNAVRQNSNADAVTGGGNSTNRLAIPKQRKRRK